MNESFADFKRSQGPEKPVSPEEQAAVVQLKRQIGDYVNLLARSDKEGILPHGLLKRFLAKVGDMTTIAEIKLYTPKLENIYKELKDTKAAGTEVDWMKIISTLGIEESPVSDDKNPAKKPRV